MVGVDGHVCIVVKIDTRRVARESFDACIGKAKEVSAAGRGVVCRERVKGVVLSLKDDLGNGHAVNVAHEAAVVGRLGGRAERCKCNGALAARVGNRHVLAHL